MLDLLKKYTRNFFPLLPFLGVPLILNLFLFGTVYRLLGNNHISFVDSGLILSGNKNPELLSVWSQNNLGYIFSLFISVNFYSKLISFTLIKLTHSIKLMQVIFYCGISLGIYYSSYLVFYKIQKLLFSSRNILFPAIAAFFYSYNLSIILATGVIDGTFHIILIAPILFYFLLNQLRNELDLRTFLWQAFLIALIASSPPFSLAFLITMYLPFLFFKENLFNLKLIKKYLLMMCLTLIASSFFIFNLVYAYLNISRGVFFSPPIGNIAFIFLEKGMRGIFQFLYDWSIALYYSPKQPHPYYQYYFNPFIIISTFLIWILSLSAVVVNWKMIKDKRSLLLIIGSLLFAIFLIKGDQPPFGSLNVFLYKVNPIMGIFRTPGSKFGVPIMLYLSLLILFALNVNKYRTISISLIAVVFIHTLIFFNPYRYIGLDTVRTQRFTATVPLEYQDVAKILNESDKEGALLLYPGINNGYFRLGNTRFLSQDVLGKLITRPLIYSDDTTMRLSRQIIDQLSVRFDAQLVGQASVRYVLIRKDFDKNRYFDQGYESKGKLLSKNSKYDRIYNSSYLSLYELKSNYYKNLISLANPKFGKSIVYEKISPTEYRVKIAASEIDNQVLVFRNSYHKDWQIKGLDKSQFAIEHGIYEGFANSWKIKKRYDSKSNSNRPIELKIYFQPEQFGYISGIISISSLLWILLYIVKSKNSKK